MASDARVRYTKMVITQSFTKILKTKPINKITVKEICAMAEINRATFYKHYLDIYDLLDKIEAQFLDELRDILNSKASNTTKDILILIMTALKADEETYKAICSSNGDPTFPAKVLETCNYITQTQINIDINKKLTQKQKEWVYQFTAHGCNGILNNWISEGMKEPISEVADFVEQLIKNSLSGC